MAESTESEIKTAVAIGLRTRLKEQTLAVKRCHKALNTLVKEYPKAFEAVNREDEGWDGNPETMGLVSLDEMYLTIVTFEDTQEELSKPQC